MKNENTTGLDDLLWGLDPHVLPNFDYLVAGGEITREFADNVKAARQAAGLPMSPEDLQPRPEVMDAADLSDCSVESFGGRDWTFENNRWNSSNLIVELPVENENFYFSCSPSSPPVKDFLWTTLKKLSLDGFSKSKEEAMLSAVEAEAKFVTAVKKLATKLQ